MHAGVHFMHGQNTQNQSPLNRIRSVKAECGAWSQIFCTPTSSARSGAGAGAAARAVGAKNQALRAGRKKRDARSVLLGDRMR